MGHKVNPIGLRLGINRTWDSRWFAGKNEYGKLLHEDLAIRKALMDELKAAAVSKIVIERPHKKCRVTIHSARPGVVIGKKGADIEKLRKKIGTMTDSEVHLNIVEVRKPETDSNLVAASIAQQLERRVAFRRAMKRAVQSAMRLGAEGIRINAGGRLGGAEIARLEWYREGRVPLHTLRATSTTVRRPLTPPTAPTASRSGCSRARSSSTTPWPPSAVRSRAAMTARPAASAGASVTTGAATVIVRAAAAVVATATRATGTARADPGDCRSLTCFSRSAPNSARPSRAASMAWPRAGST